MPTRDRPRSGAANLWDQAPITTATIGLAIVITLYFWYGRDASFIPMTPASFTSEPWRLVTSTLAHGNFLHLFFNLYWMKIFGPALEQRLHPLVVLTLYVTVAAGSGAAQFAVGVGGVGLSGVLYGIFGFLWFANTRADAFRGLLPASTIKLLVGWFFLCIVATRIGAMNVANVAHGIGGLMGWVAGWVALSPRATRPLKTLAYYGLLGLFLLAGSIWREPLLARFAGDGYAEYAEYLAAHDDSTTFMDEVMELEGELEGEDWAEIRERAAVLIERYDRPDDPPLAIARLLYLRGFASMRLSNFQQALADAERAIAIHAEEPGAAELAEGCRSVLDLRTE